MSLPTASQREPLRDHLGLTSRVVRRLLLWAFLVGGAASGITGDVIYVDAGLHNMA